MTNMTLQAVRQLIDNDSYAITFQSVEQYRSSLMRHFDSLVDGPVALAELPALAAQSQGTQAAPDELLDMLGRVHPYAMPMGDFKRAEERLERAVNLQQPLPVPDQAAIVWRGDLMSLMAELQQKRSVFDDWKKMRAQRAAAPGALLEILRDVHDTLASESDSDIDHFENDDEEREGAPAQYAARKVMEVMDMLKATPLSASGTPEAPKERA